MPQDPLAPGLRDELITDELARQLENAADRALSRPLEPSEALERLGKHLLRVARRLRAPSDDVKTLAPNDPRDVTATDLYAISLLDVQARPRGGRRLVDTGCYRDRVVAALFDPHLSMEHELASAGPRRSPSRRALPRGTSASRWAGTTASTGRSTGTSSPTST